MSILVLLKYNLILYWRTSYFLNKNIKFILILIPVYLYLIYKTFIINNVFAYMASIFLVIGIFSFQSIKDGSFMRSSYLIPLLLNKSSSFIYGLFSEMFIKILIVLPFIIFVLQSSFSLFIYCLLSTVLFILIIYLLSELSLINKVFLTIYNLFTVLPIFFITLLGIDRLGLENSKVFSYLENHASGIFNRILLCEVIIVFILVILYKKKYYNLIYN